MPYAGPDRREKANEYQRAWRARKLAADPAGFRARQAASHLTWVEANHDKVLAYRRAQPRRPVANSPERQTKVLAYRQAYYEAHGDELRANARAYQTERRQDPEYRVQQYANSNAATLANPEVARARRSAYRQKHLTTRRAGEAAKRANPIYAAGARERTLAWRRAHPEESLAQQHTKRRRKAGVLLTVRVESTDCGVCLLPLVPDASSRSPFSTTVGHEPPLSRVAREGWLIVFERPEHWACNRRKGTRMDYELTRAERV